ncbi:hypothetical protein L6452_28018 [Arctium lappa]|uniref:Uncharacterized protein n=1 Tax=Arctium lappa TaxID=4217 RepID=A0ACB8ZY35_ARCLA|nr:hypothetical protein L6452_28018 [Arctium lappa]
MEVVDFLSLSLLTPLLSSATAIDEDHKVERDEQKGKAKAEEETDHKTLPPTIEPKVISNANGDLFYIKVVGQRRAHKAIDADSSAEEVQRKLFWVRNKDVYTMGFVPKALMPITLCHHGMVIPLSKVVIPYVGIDGKNILKMKLQSGAWI